MRSSLTMLGIIIGISSVIMITGIGAGVKNSVFDVASSISRSVIQVYANGGTSEDRINFEDAEAVANIDNVAKVTACSEWWGMKINLRIPGETEEGSLGGVDENYSIIESYEISLGRFISKNDVENRSNVAVIKSSTAVKVFGRVNCIGEKIEIDTNYYGTQEFTVIGILSEGEENMISQMLNTPLTRSVAIIPVTTMDDIFNSGGIVDVFGVGVHDVSKSSETCENITNLLDIRHNRTNGYYAESMGEQFDMINVVLNAITGFIAFVAAISLFVGGVGVMNIMLVTVKERTREIGIRKSLGATRGAIKLQFVMEAAILSALGGITGLILGKLGAQGIGILISGLLKTPVVPVVSVPVIAIAIGVSSLVGILFGVYPAGKAAKLDPVEALRYE